MNIPSTEMNFCRRCGTPLHHKEKHVYICQNEHVIFCNASPAVGVLLLNNKGEVLVLERAIQPGKGLLDAPGGFCDGDESLEDAIARELEEEIGFVPADYTTPQFFLSDVDDYMYRGEELWTLGVMFTATMRTHKQPQPADDAAKAYFVPIAEVDLEKVYFSAVRAGFAKLRQQ